MTEYWQRLKKFAKGYKVNKRIAPLVEKCSPSASWTLHMARLYPDPAGCFETGWPEGLKMVREVVLHWIGEGSQMFLVIFRYDDQASIETDPRRMRTVLSPSSVKRV